MNRIDAARQLLVTATTLMLFTACTQSTQDLATANPPQPSTPAAPPDFPGLSTFADAYYSVYGVVDMPQVQGLAFTTSLGLHCSNNAYPTPETEWVRCWGPRPDRGPGVWSVEAERSAPAVIKQLVPNPDFEPSARPPAPLLPPSTKITAVKGNSICGLDTGGKTFCRIGDHGFVLTPTSTRLF